ncbi:glycosyltransferase [Lactococcus hodotermopsidis]|nr:glycosyltransferase [Lactococcus hodotermopsidis]
MEKRKKILLVIEAMSGGAGRHVRDLVLNLEQEKFDLFLIYSTQRINYNFIENLADFNNCVTLLPCDFLLREVNLKGDMNAYRFVSKKIKEIKPDVVHCHSSKAGVIGRMAAKRHRVKRVFYTPHAYSFLAPEFGIKKKKLFIAIEKFLSHHATTKTFCVSKGEKQAALDVGIDKAEKFEIIYNGLPDLPLVDKSSVKAQLGLDETAIVIGNNARLSEQKNPLFFMMIAQKMIEQDPNFHFVWAGEGQLFQNCQTFIEEKKLDENIHLLGNRNDSEFIVTGYDVFLTTSQYEGLPYAPIEAMRASVPIIATDVVGNREIVKNGVNGYLIESEWSDNIIEKLNQALTLNPLAVNKNFKDRFSIETMLEQIETFYLAEQIKSRRTFDEY